MSSLLDQFLNLLGYYNLTAAEFFAYYGYDYYIPSRKQLYTRVALTDQVLIDVASSEIAKAIGVQLETTNIQYEITYDFQPLFDTNNTTALQAERVIDQVLNDLETKGYKVFETNIATQFVIRWKFKLNRMFKRIRLDM